MDSQVLDLSVPSRNKLYSERSNFYDVSDSESSRGASPINNRCPPQQFYEHQVSMRLPTKLKSLTDGSGQSEDEFESPQLEVISHNRFPDDKDIFRNYYHSPTKISSPPGYKVPENLYQRNGTFEWIQQSQEYFHKSNFNFDQFRIKSDSKMNRSPGRRDETKFMNNPALDLSSTSNKSEVSPNKVSSVPTPQFQSPPMDGTSNHHLNYKPGMYQSMKDGPASSPPRNDPPSSTDFDSVVSKTVDGITVTLHDPNLWNAFRKHGTEMIINRNGRRMFPHLDLSLQGLNESRLYNILLEVCPADDKRYKFINNKWTPVGMADPMLPNPPVLHHDSPNIGSFWMGKLSFAKVKITNHRDSNEGMIVLQSMHKYMIKVIIQPAGSDGKSLQNEIVIPLEETAFFAVTAYQNETIIQLKIRNNPFAKAFRDQPSRSRHAGKNQIENSNENKRVNEGDAVQNKRKRYEHLEKSKKIQYFQTSPPSSMLSLASVLPESPRDLHEPVFSPYFNFNGLSYMGFGGMPGFGFPQFLPSMLYPPQS